MDLSVANETDMHMLLHQKEVELQNLRETSLRDLEKKVSHMYKQNDQLFCYADQRMSAGGSRLSAGTHC
jgi:hypothetical protein